MADSDKAGTQNEPYRLYDNKERAFVNQKQYASLSSANRAAERRNLEYGAHRYSAEKYSNIVQESNLRAERHNMRNMYGPPSNSSGRGAGSTGGGSFNFPGSAGTRPGVSPMDDNLARFAKGGSTSVRHRGDGIAQRGKTKGKMR
jgi:hypothetical protein